MDGVRWPLRRIKDMSVDELLVERHRHRDDGAGWCAADCKTGMFLHWHPCDLYRAVVAELDGRRGRAGCGYDRRSREVG